MVGNVLRVRYELTQLVSEGPIFATYAARDRLQVRDVCVRLIRDPFGHQQEFIQKLRENIQRYAVVQHPGIEQMLEIDEDEGSTFLISELTKGTTLDERIKKLAPFSVPVAVSTSISLCEALEALHAAELPHGDISAHNIVALPDGQVRLQLPGTWAVYATNPLAASMVLPSMSPYLAPEVSAGGTPSPASDVYAAGVVLYELLTGRLPYNADTPVSMALKHATGTVPSVRMYNPSVPAVLDEIVKKALAKDPGGRYSSGGALLSDLRVLQDALRFGKTVTWPITPEPLPEQAPRMPKTSVTPRSESKPQPEPRRQRTAREGSDVHLIIWILIAIFGSATATIIGIFFFFNLSKPNLVKVPSLSGLTVAEAREMVKPSKIDIEIASEQSSEKVPADHIISTNPDAGERVREGGHVRVIVSSGSRLVQVPDLKGNSVDQARSILQSAHLDLDDNVQTTRSSTVQSGLIVSQEPAAGKKVDHATKVKIVVSSGDLGASGGSHLYTLRVRLKDLPDTVTLRVDVEDENGSRTVYEDQHEPEEVVEISTWAVGKEVTFKVYYDNELVRTVTQTADQAAKPDGDTNQ